MFVSILIAFVLHGLVFVAVQYGITADEDEPEEQIGPITVTLYEPSQAESLQAAAEQERGAQRERTKSETPTRRERRLKDRKTAPAADREQFATEPAPTSPPETGHPEIAKQEPTPRLERQDTGFEPSEDLRQRGGEVEKSELEAFEEYGRVEEWVETDQAFVVDQEWEQEEDVRETGPVLPTRPDEDEEFSLNMESLDRAIEEGGEGDTGGVADSRTGGQRDTSRETGVPSITWDEGSRGRTLLSSGELPKIPDWVKREGLDLRVEVSFSVTPEGHTISLVVNRSSGYPDVDATVLESVRNLRFNPIRDERYARGKISYLISTN
jgi:TonB family protein